MMSNSESRGTIKLFRCLTLDDKDIRIACLSNLVQCCESKPFVYDFLLFGCLCLNLYQLVYSYLITNKRVVSDSQVLNLDDVSNCRAAMNEERVHGGSVNRVGTYTKGTNVRLSSYRGRGTALLVM